MKTPNYKKIFEVFNKHYKEIPLEIFGSDPYKTLISTLLSSRTKDEVTYEAAKRLFKVAPDVFSLNQLGELEIRNLIYPVGFYKTKAIYLKKLSKIVINKFDSQIPKSRDDLMTLPGVGRKTANLVLNRAYGISAIAVDTHVHKISNLLKLVKTETPEKTERALMTTLPTKYWSSINRLFVSIGRQYYSKKKLLEFLNDNGLMRQ